MTLLAAFLMTVVLARCDTSRFLAEESGNVDAAGNFSIQVRSCDTHPENAEQRETGLVCGRECARSPDVPFCVLST